MRLKNKVAIVTGGSRGIGRAVVRKFLKEGAMVAIAARSKTEIDITVKNLKQEGELITGIPTDVSKGRDVQNLVERTLTQYGSLDILVNAAGMQGPIGPFIEVDMQEWINNIHTNLIGTGLCCKASLPIMIGKRQGKIINFSGGGATSPRPNFSAYACSKAAIVRFTETLAMEVKDYGVDVNAIAPGAVNTRMMAEIINAGDKSGKKELSETIERSQKGGTPPELAAELVVFLASEHSNGLTGRLISAVWDDWKNFDENVDEITNSSLYTLRRIDKKNFIERRS
ncbi:MAG TPA: SDR family NAD(P)-dependent oxidoreductase [Candidatus Brocadiia bacterium]|nr:SDR family oxidoreductase [Candidatus Brocadiales bacterium]